MVGNTRCVPKMIKLEPVRSHGTATVWSGSGTGMWWKISRAYCRRYAGSWKSPSPPWGAERVGVRWGIVADKTHLTLPIAAAMGPLSLPPRAGGEGEKAHRIHVRQGADRQSGG